jgi:hypothetical protein
MIEVQTVLELAKDRQPWKVAKMTGYTTAQVNQMLKRHGQHPFVVKPIRHGVSRIQGERRQLLLEKIKRIIAYKEQHNCGTVPAVKQMGENIPPMVVNRWIRNFTASGEL